MGNTSATGVGFTRNPATGENDFYGEFLNERSGRRRRRRHPHADADREAGRGHAGGLTGSCGRYGETREALQGRAGLRVHHPGEQATTCCRPATASDGFAAVRFAVDMVKEGICTKEEALQTIDPISLNQLLHPIFDLAARRRRRASREGSRPRRRSHGTARLHGR